MPSKRGGKMPALTTKGRQTRQDSPDETVSPAPTPAPASASESAPAPSSAPAQSPASTPAPSAAPAPSTALVPTPSPAPVTTKKRAPRRLAPAPRKQTVAAQRRSNYAGSAASSRLPPSLPIPDMPANQARKLRTFLNSLAAQSSALFQQLVSPANDSWDDDLEDYRTAVQPVRAHYPVRLGFVDERMVLPIVAPNGGLAFQTASKAIAAVNLTVLLDNLHRVDADREERYSFIEDLDKAFPTAFYPYGESSNELDLAREIRIQRLVEACHTHQDTNPLTHFAKVFYDIDTEAESQSELEDLLHGARLRPLAGRDPASEKNAWVDQYLQQVQNVRLEITDEDHASIRATIEEAHPYKAFSNELREWIGIQHDDVAQSDAAQAAESLVDLGEVRRDSYSGLSIESQLQAQLRAESAHSQPRAFDPAAMHFLYQSPRTGIPPSDAGSYTSYLVASARQGLNSMMPPPSGQKRAYGYISTQSDMGDDEVFQTDARTPKRARKRTLATRPSLDAALAGYPPRSSAPRGTQLPPPSSAGQVALSQAAREMTKQHRKEKVIKTRKAWTDKDVELLIKATHLHEASWSKIEKWWQRDDEPGTPEDELRDHKDRDQQSLRDKARLFKYHLLLTDRLLPPSFDLVKLGAKEKAGVEACNKNPERSEEDYEDIILTTGVVERKATNTLYMPPLEGAI